MVIREEICPECGSEEFQISGRFGSEPTWLCNECGYTLIGNGEKKLDEDDEDGDFMTDKASEGMNLIKASKMAKVAKPIKKVSKTKSSKGRRK